MWHFAFLVVVVVVGVLLVLQATTLIENNLSPILHPETLVFYWNDMELLLVSFRKEQSDHCRHKKLWGEMWCLILSQGTVVTYVTGDVPFSLRERCHCVLRRTLWGNNYHLAITFVYALL